MKEYELRTRTTRRSRSSLNPNQTRSVVFEKLVVAKLLCQEQLEISYEKKSSEKVGNGERVRNAWESAEQFGPNPEES
ncbi:hypothetical protein CDL12_05080 [Handroanthus impetiginosus]|uniref:Uncharacterized protein n=1 Tax=Handroanthus impetiginosus TaxID=429701 RepID=A0A2G9HXH7_9LAMI|nr:hypothetical protein CDL12_05080 [Handroanthus impetiginosus]